MDHSQGKLHASLDSRRAFKMGELTWQWHKGIHPVKWASEWGSLCANIFASKTLFKLLCKSQQIATDQIGQDAAPVTATLKKQWKVVFSDWYSAFFFVVCFEVNLQLQSPSSSTTHVKLCTVCTRTTSGNAVQFYPIFWKITGEHKVLGFM